MDAEIAYLPVTALLAAFRARELSPLDYVKLLIARTAMLAPALNPYTETFFEQALAAASEAERIYRSPGRTPRPLEGIPLVLKDLHPLAGHRTTYGCHLLQDNIASETAPAVERLLAAGAILLARTTVPEFGLSFACNTRLWGVTRNPWNPAFSPGGSTSGGAAALAAGLAPLADASDYGGSIRVPAAFCGLFGFKPPYGRVPGERASSLDRLGVHGVLTRTVEDAALVYDVLYGPDPRDMSSLVPKLELPREFEGIAGWKIGYSPDLGFFEVAEEVRARTLESLAMFRELGCSVAPVAVDWSLATLAAYEIHAAAGFCASWSRRFAGREDELGPRARQRLVLGPKLAASDLYATLGIRAEMYTKLQAVFEQCDVLVCPAAAVTGVPAEASGHEGDQVEWNGLMIASEQQLSLTYPFNLLPQLPVASVPIGYAAKGLPMAIQIVGRPYADIAVLRAARAIERLRSWTERPALEAVRA